MIKRREETREFVEILNYAMFEEYKPFINRWIILKKKRNMYYTLQNHKNKVIIIPTFLIENTRRII